jgi:hypothetical protein
MSCSSAALISVVVPGAGVAASVEFDAGAAPVVAAPGAAAGAVAGAPPAAGGGVVVALEVVVLVEAVFGTGFTNNA